MGLNQFSLGPDVFFWGVMNFRKFQLRENQKSPRGLTQVASADFEQRLKEPGRVCFFSWNNGFNSVAWSYGKWQFIVGTMENGHLWMIYQ